MTTVLGDILGDVGDKLAQDNIKVGNVYLINLDQQNGITPKNGDLTRDKFFIVKSSRLFPLSYLFQKNQYKCDIVPSLPAGLCGIEPVEHAPV